MMLEGLHIQQRSSGQWLVGSDSGRHVLVGSEVLAVVRSLERSQDMDAAFMDYRLQGGVLDLPGFSSCAEHCVSLLASGGGAGYQNLPLRWRLLSPQWTGRVAARMAFLFEWPGALVPSTLSLTAFGMALAALFQGSMGSIGHVEPLWAGTVAVMVVLGIVLHELGHAAALRSAGEPPGEIGLGLYYGFLPMLYSGLSRAWRLGLRGRITVNLGGIHLQAAFAGVLFLLAAALPAEGAIQWALRLAAITTVAAALLQLMPLSGTDGYWVLADLLDEPALSRYEPSLLRDAVRGEKGTRTRALVRIGYLVFSWSVLLWLLSVALHSATALGREAVAWMSGAPAGHHLASVNGWLGALVTVLLLRRLFAQAFQLLKGAPQTPEEGSSVSAVMRK